MPLALRHVSKSFGGQAALRDVDLTLDYGEVHALVGQNGSGKSTLIKLLAGYHQADPGSVATINGEPLALGNAAAAKEAGLRFVHQDLGLVLPMSVLDNLMLGGDYEQGAGGRILWRQARRRVARHLTELKIHVDLDAPVGSLTMAERAGIAIGRTLLSSDNEQRCFIVLDEPTAALPQDEVSRLLQVIRRLREQGHGVLLVSHHLAEILDVADSITVLRDARVVRTVARSEVDAPLLTELIVGRPLSEPNAVDRRTDDFRAESAALSVRRLRGGRLVDFTCELHSGRVLGIAGITGSGRESIAPLLIGRIPFRGEVRVLGRPVRAGRPRESLRAGIASVPGERARYGLFPNLNVRANLSISELTRHRRWGRIRVTAERRDVDDWIGRLNIVTRGQEAPITSLSGGNQQKVLVARALRLNPKVLVLDDPTQGIDIGARAQIHEIIERCAADGMAIVLVSTDTDEIVRLSDEVIILVGGRPSARLVRGPGLNVEAVDHGQLEANRHTTTTSTGS
jgi:ribose transport system ATP-binding protein